MENEALMRSLFEDAFVKTFNPYSRAVFANIQSCHTAKRGYHLYRCNNANCLATTYRYHCCGNRHCPWCGTIKRDQWVESRKEQLLPTPYYHIVFTLPHQLNTLLLANRISLFNALFEAASTTLLNHGKNPDYLGAEPGITMVLHTWGQDLSFHPHVHCIVSGGGWNGSRWIEAKRKNNRFLFPSKSLSKMYKAIFIKTLENTKLNWDMVDKDKLLRTIGYKNWVVYAKAPFGGPAQVIEYLGRYTHKIAITHHRILEVTETKVRFKYKDYADGNKAKTMWLTRQEFVRRFELHILPQRFVKIRHRGFLRSRDKMKRLALIREDLKLQVLPPKSEDPFGSADAGKVWRGHHYMYRMRLWATGICNGLKATTDIKGKTRVSNSTILTICGNEGQKEKGSFHNILVSSIPRLIGVGGTIFSANHPATILPDQLPFYTQKEPPRFCKSS